MVSTEKVSAHRGASVTADPIVRNVVSVLHFCKVGPLLSMILGALYLLCRVDSRRAPATRRLTAGQRVDLLATATCVVLLVDVLVVLGAIR
jgi:hypothetical protein